MASIKDLLEKAIISIQDTNQSAASDFRLEEFDKDQKSIVVSYLLPETNPIKGLGVALANRPYERVYKTVFFDAANEVSSVKIYKK